MSAEDGVLRDLLEPGARTKVLWRGALDLIFPPQALDVGEAATAGGLSAAWLMTSGPQASPRKAARGP
jgi:hypothetical protein